jgi:uncharacterized protein
MTLGDLQQDLNTSLKAGKAVRVATLRLLVSAIRNAAIGKYGAAWETSVTDADVLDVVKKQIKTHKESVGAFENAGRTELAQKEKDELNVLEEFAPKELSDDELKAILMPVVQSGEANFGLVMKAAMAAIAGRADGGRVSSMVKQLMKK